VPANVVERPQFAVIAPHDDHVLIGNRRQEVLAWNQRVLFAANRHPAACEPHILLVVQDFLVVVHARRQDERFERRHAHIGDFVSADRRDRDRALPGCSGRIDHATNLQGECAFQQIAS